MLNLEKTDQQTKSDQQKAELKELINDYGMLTIDRFCGSASDKSVDELESRIDQLIDQM